MKRALFPVTLLALSSVAVSDQPHGGSWKDAQVAEIVAHTDGGHEGKGHVVVTFVANGTGTASCASGYPRSVAIDISTVGGAFAAAVMQSALLSGMSVTVAGTGSCSVSPTIETVASVQETGHTGPTTMMNSGALPPPQPGH